MTVALRCTGVRVRYGGIEVLHGVDLAVPYGTLTALVGSNGAGKSTLLAWCAGAETTATSTAGRLTLARDASSPRDATTWSATRRAAYGLRLVPSGVNVFQSMSVADNLLASGDLDVAVELFPELAALLPQQAGTLSGGQRQLLAVAGAISGRWRVLLVDEPVQGIAAELADRVYEGLAAAVTSDRAVLVADPVTSRAARIADFVWRLERGRVTFAGEAGELGRHDLGRHNYGA
jgi:branched-chain amino acid transport system ATP-binding protein